jgi:predicted nucleic acid-binding Zn ribbon protein
MTNIAPHKHCIVCGKDIGPDGTFCDMVCESKYKSAQKRQQILFIIFIILLLLVLFIPSLIKTTG